MKRVEFKLNNDWALEMTLEYPDEEGIPYVISCKIFRKNGSWELEVEGQVKRTECCDWGYGKPTMIHYCGREDTTLFTRVYDECMAYIGEFEEVAEKVAWEKFVNG